MKKGLSLEPVVLSARPGVFVSQAQALIGFSEATTQVMVNGFEPTITQETAEKNYFLFRTQVYTSA